MEMKFVQTLLLFVYRYIHASRNRPSGRNSAHIRDAACDYNVVVDLVLSVHIYNVQTVLTLFM